MTAFSILIEHNRVVRLVESIINIVNAHVAHVARIANSYLPDSNQVMIEFYGVQSYGGPVYQSTNPRGAKIDYIVHGINKSIWIEYLDCVYSIKVSLDEEGEDVDLTMEITNLLTKHNIQFNLGA